MSYWGDGWRILVQAVEQSLTARRRRILIGVVFSSAALTAALAVLIAPVLSDISVSARVILLLSMVGTVSGTAAMICLRVFVRVRKPGWGPQGLITAEMEKAIGVALKERRRPELTASQDEFMNAQARHARKVMPALILLQLVAVPTLPFIIVAAAIYGSSLPFWATSAIIICNLTSCAYYIVVLGRTTLFVPIDEIRNADAGRG